MLVAVQQVPGELLCEVGPLPGEGAGHRVTVVPQPGPAQPQPQPVPAGVAPGQDSATCRQLEAGGGHSALCTSPIVKSPH